MRDVNKLSHNDGKNILVEVHHGIGDVILMLPLIETLRKKFPTAKIDVIVGTPAAYDIVQSTNNVNQIECFSLSKMTFTKIVKFIFKMRKRDYDLGFISPITNQICGPILFKLLGCKSSVYMSKKEIKCKTDIVVKYFQAHTMEQNMSLLRAVNVYPENIVPQIRIEDELLLWANKMLKNVFRSKKTIGIVIGTNPIVKKGLIHSRKYNVKQWGIRNYIMLIERLKLDYNIILFGGKKEEEEIEKEEIDMSSLGCVNFVNKATIMQSIALLQHCDLVVGGDTGLIHAADAVGTTTVVLYGPTDPKRWGPISGSTHAITLELPCQYCQGEMRIFECDDRECIRGIKVVDVYKSVMEIVEEKK